LYGFKPIGVTVTKISVRPQKQEAPLSQKPHDASCHWIFRKVTQGHSRSFEM